MTPPVSARVPILSAGDRVVPALLLVLGELSVWTGNVDGSRLLLAVGIAVAGVALTARRRRPLATLVVIGAALLAPAAAGSYAESLPAVLMLVVAVFATGRYGGPPLSYLGAPLGVALALLGSAADPQETLASSWSWSLNALWIFGIGLWLRQTDELVRRTRQEREAVAGMAAAEERLRVAQDLHDVLAHSLSVMVVQAEVADELLAADPAAARTAITRVQATGREALTETRSVLGLLRTGQSPADRRGLDDVAALVGDFRAAGLPVVLDYPTTPKVSTAVDQAVYRMLQEALTNVMRHAGTQPTTVRLRELAGRLEVTVENDGPPSAPTVVGNGLTGMRERVESCGGSLRLGPRSGGGFLVHAELPTAEAFA